MSAPEPLDISAEDWQLRTGEREPWLRGYLGNGFLAAQLVAEGGLAGDGGQPLHLMAGLYDRAEGDEVERPVPIPAWSTLRLSIAGERLRPSLARDYQQSLDPRRGLAETVHLWAAAGTEVRARTTQAILRHEQHLALVVLSLEADRACEIDIHAELNAAGPRVPQVERGCVEGGQIWIEGRTAERDVGIAAAGALFHGTRSPVVESDFAVCRLALEPGKAETVTWLVAVHSDRTAAMPREAALADLARARALGSSRLLADHQAAWAALWQADIVVEGDAEVQRFVRAGMFALLCSQRAGINASVAPMGISSLGYNGHIFWDADTWMFPPLLMLHPDVARGIVAYRHDRLLPARARARAAGYAGAMFPWESATDGDDTTPLSIARTGLKEHHITACVALAQWQYYLATGDRAWLADRGWPVLEAAAAFWTSRVTKAPDGYAILDVICADEYAEDVDNNAFTNASARAALLAAIAAAAVLGHAPPPAWQEVAAGLIVRRDGDLVLEFDGYDGRMIKQADVELLTFPLEYPLSEASILRNLETYRRATDPDAPAMSRCMSAIVAAQLGRREEALALFSACYGPNLYGPFYALAETRTNGEVNFLTGIGGAMQTLLFGFAGLRIHERAPAFDPLLPHGWRALRFPAIQWRGRTLALAVLPDDRLEVTAVEAGLTVGLALHRWRPGPAPLRVEAIVEEATECRLDAEGWRIEPMPNSSSWQVWPPDSGPATAFLLLRLTVRDMRGENLVLEIEQRVSSGDLAQT